MQRAGDLVGRPKHRSAVAKVHYQKQRLREVAVRGPECLQKLQGSKGSQVDVDVAPSVETVVKTSPSSPPEKDVPPTKRLHIQGKLSHRTSKSMVDEDNFLEKVINRHSLG